jgi:hypothetical protein
MHRDPNKIIIPVSEKCKYTPVHIRGKLVCRTYVPSSEVGLTAVIKQQPVITTESVTPVKTVKSKTVYPTLGAMFTHNVVTEEQPKKQLTTDEITVLGLKRITIERILNEYKHSTNVYQIAEYIIGKHVFNSLSADQRGMLYVKVTLIMCENNLPYYYKVPNAPIPIIPASEAESNNKVTIDEFRSEILASANKAVWVSLDDVVQIVGDHALGNSVLAHKMAVNKDLKEHNLLIVDSGIATDQTTVIIKVADTSDTIGSIAIIENIKGTLIAAGSKKALWFSYENIAQGLGINLNALSTAEADKVIKQYLERNGVFVVYKGVTATGEPSIRLGFTKPVKAKRN